MDIQDILTAIKPDWPEPVIDILKMAEELVTILGDGERTVLDLVDRPGISRSVRASIIPPKKDGRPVFSVLDIITPKDGDWYISFCFYEDEISDPDELGECVPFGLFGENGYCFNLEEFDLSLLDYLSNRIDEARKKALSV